MGKSLGGRRAVQARQERADHTNGAVIVFEGFEGAVTMEALEQHYAPAGVAVQEAGYSTAVPLDEAEDCSRRFSPRNLQLQRCARPVGATHRYDDPRSPRSNHTLWSELPLVKKVAGYRRQHTCPCAGGVVTALERTENPRRNDELLIAAHTEKFTTASDR